MMNENPNLVLVKSVVGWYINRHLAEPNGKLEGIVEKAIGLVKMPADVMGEGSEGEIAHALRSTLDWLRTLSPDVTVDKVDLIERIRMNCAFGSDYIASIERQCVLYDDMHLNAERVKTIISELQYSIRNHEYALLYRKANKEINFGDGTVDILQHAKEMQEKIREFENTGEEEKKGFGGSLSTTDIDSVVEAMRRTQELNSTEGTLKTGLKGLNRALGGLGHFRGEQFNYGALTHNYKTGILLDYCRWFPLYNTPHMLDKNKKPLVLRVSFENKIEQDLPLIYRSLWEQENKKKLDLAEVDAEEAARYVIDRLRVNGYEFEMRCYDPNQFDVWDLIDVLSFYEAKGYEIHAVIVDYPELITKKYSGKGSKRTDEIITYTFEVLRNHCFPRGITQLTAHQLSSDARRLAREGTSNLAKKFAEGSYYYNAVGLSQKLDGEMLLHIHEIGDKKFLTASLGKRRGTSDNTPTKHKTFYYEFTEFGICDDLDVEASEGNALYSFAGLDGGAEGIETGGYIIEDNLEEAW